MALIYTESFDNYTATADLTDRWESVGTGITFNSTAGIDGGGAIVLGGANNGTSITPYNYHFSVNSGFLYWGFWIKISAKPSSTMNIAGIRYNSSLFAAYLQVNTSGHLIDFRNNWSGTGGTDICDNNWHWLEFQHQITNGNSGGNVWVDDTFDIVTGNALNWGAGHSINGIYFINNSQGITVTVDDIIWYTAASPSPQTSDYPLSKRKITVLRPTSDDTVQFTPDTGSTNYTQVDEFPADNDTSYVEDGTSSDQDLYGYENLSFTPTDITAVMVNSRINNPGLGNINYQQICKSSATQTNGTSVVCPITYRVNQQPFEIDPNTSSAWTKSGIDSALFGIKVV